MIKQVFSSLISWIVSFQLISIIIAYTTRFEMYPWYEQLLKSSLTPPGYYFGVIWPLLYITLSILGWKLYTENKNSLLKWYWIGMIINWLWSPVFFILHLSGLALSILAMLVFINGYILIKLKTIYYYNYTYLIILPYFLWLCFAGYLNIIIVLLN